MTYAKVKWLIRVLISLSFVIFLFAAVTRCAHQVKVMVAPPAQRLERNYSTSLASAPSTGWKDTLAYLRIIVPFKTGDTKHFLLPRYKIFAALRDIRQDPGIKIQITGLPDEDLIWPEQVTLANMRAETMRNVLIEGGFAANRIFLRYPEDVIPAEIPKKGGVMLGFFSPQEILPPKEMLDYHWNIWAQAPNERFKPISVLRPLKKYTVNVDLSGIGYDLPGMQTFLVEREFCDLIYKKAKKGEDILRLDVVLLMDQRFFNTSSQILGKLEINLKNVREFKPGSEKISTSQLIETLTNEVNPLFVFDHLSFEVETKERLGWGSIGLSFWHKGRPFDELSISFCIDREGQMCSGKIKGDGATLAGSELFEVASDTTLQRPDAALHLIEFSDSFVAGVFARNDKEIASKLEDYSVWTVSNNKDVFRNKMNQIRNNFGRAKGDPVSVGRSLLNLIFPPRDEKAKLALQALESFYKDKKTSGTFPLDRPTLFVRFIRQKHGETSLYPIGLINMDRTLEGFLGYHLQIHTPLPEQDYSQQSCPRSWQTVLPVQTSDPALRDAHQRFANRFTINPFKQEETRYNFGVGSVPVFSRFNRFNRWIDNRGYRDATTLMVVSHHDQNSLYFIQESSILHSSNVSVSLLGPSVAFLVGCSTGQPGAGSIANALNQAGVQTIIATNTGISGALAGDFLELLTRRVEDSEEPVPIGRLFSQVQRDLYELKTTTGNVYGASVLSFTLAGNPTMEVCRP